MRVLRLDALAHRPLDTNGSRGFAMGAFGLTAEAALVSVTLRPGGVIGRHPAAGTQLLVVLHGDAVVSGADGDPVTIGPGSAAVWDADEPHETHTVCGLLALVLEGDLDLATPGHQVDPGDT